MVMTAGALDSIRVLHVDDDPDFSNLSAKFLKRTDERLSVETASSVSAGLDRLRQAEFDCVVSDFDLPEENGIEFLEAVRQDSPQLPFILFTGKGSEEVASEAISAGVTDYLQKQAGTSQYEVLANRIVNAVGRDRANVRAAETEQRLRTIADNTDDVLWMFSADWEELLFINSQYEEMWGHSIEELEEKPDSFLDAVHPDDRHKTIAAMDRLSNGESIDYEHRVNPKEDFGRWVWAQGAPIFDDAGEVVKVAGFVRDISDRKERELHLQHERNRFQAVFEESFDAMVIADDEGKFIDANESASTLFGVSEEELLGRSIAEFAPDDFDFAGAWSAFHNSETERGTFPLVRPDGSKRSVEYAATSHIVPGHHLSILRDITERTEREQRYNAIFNQTYQFTGLLEPDGTLIEANETALRFGGLERDDVVGKKMWDAYWFQHSEETSERAKNAVERAASGEFVRHELPVQGADGEEVVIDFSVRPITDELGDVTFLVPEGRDITERLEHERELESKNRRLEAILENTTTPMFMKADNSEYLLVNRGYRELFGLEDEEIVGRTDYDIHPPEMADAVTKNDQLVIEDGETVEAEERIIVHGEERTFLTTKVPIYDIGERSDSNRPVAVFGVASDITKLKAREQELQRERNRLDEFASVVSHDLRNPLRVAEGNLQLAIEDGDPEALDAVARALERMDTLIEDMLSLANTGDTIGETERVDLASIAEACWHNVESASAEFDLQAEGSIQADKTRLQQLLENLFRNAIEHAGKDVTITVGDLTDGFYVEDDGPGIPPAERDNVLDPGYSTRENGSGFGLNIVRDIAEGHGWQIAVTESAEGGARFEFIGLDGM